VLIECISWLIKVTAMPLRVTPKAVGILLGQLNDFEILKKKCIPRVYLTSYLGYPKFARFCELCWSPQLCFSFSEQFC